MTSPKPVLSCIFNVFLIFLVGVAFPCNANDLKACGFNAIYQFGDSMSDTGTAAVVHPRAPQARLPYGISRGEATGRPSDGLLLIDFIAKSAGLPYLEPYLNPNMTFLHGANFAFAGTTALPMEMLIPGGDSMFRRNLAAQVGFMDTFLRNRICNRTEDCREKLKSSLFMLGEMGHNDYSITLSYKWTPAEVKAKRVPQVIQAIKEAIVRLVKFGATRIVVPGHFQLGCAPFAYIEFKQNYNSSGYDKNGCMKDINSIYEYSNEQLQIAIADVQKQYPNVIIAYGDYYKSYQWVLDRFDELGFKDLQKGCCGPPPIDCSSANATVCANPAQSIYWDGGHYSQAANYYISKQLIADILPKLRCGQVV